MVKCVCVCVCSPQPHCKYQVKATPGSRPILFLPVRPERGRPVFPVGRRLELLFDVAWPSVSRGQNLAGSRCLFAASDHPGVQYIYTGQILKVYLIYHLQYRYSRYSCFNVYIYIYTHMPPNGWRMAHMPI